MRLKNNDKISMESLLETMRSLEKEIESLKKSELSNHIKLRERIKELNCIYKMSNLYQSKDMTVSEMLQSIVCIIPESWRYPKSTCARIIVNNAIYQTNNFKVTKFKLDSIISNSSGNIGVLEVYYSGNKISRGSTPFLPEERKLMQVITENLGKFIELKTTEEKLKLNEIKLQERLKELNCIHEISRIYEKKNISLDNLLTEIVSLVPKSWQHPKYACAVIKIGNKIFKSADFSETKLKLSSEIRYAENLLGEVSVYYRKNPTKDYCEIFLEDEKKLIHTIAQRIGHIFELKKSEKESERYMKQLEESNIALKNVLSQIESEKNSIRENVAINIEKNIKPLIKTLLNRKSFDKSILKVILNHLDHISSGFYRRIISLRYNLTPAEIRISQTLLAGYLIKEIAEINSISISTVKTHIKNIRKKLGLKKRTDNLRIFLERFNDSRISQNSYFSSDIKF